MAEEIPISPFTPTSPRRRQIVLPPLSRTRSIGLDVPNEDGEFRARSRSLSALNAGERRKKFAFNLLSLLGPPSPTLRQEKVTVYIRVIFMKLGEIDTVKECFSADAFIQAKWREPKLDDRTDLKPEDIKWEDYWQPKLSVLNAVGDPKETTWHTILFNSTKQAYICKRRRIKGTFLENLELNEFPFDTQDLTLTIMSERSEDEVELEEDGSEMSTINVESFVDEQEWILYKYVMTTKNVFDGAYEGSLSKHPVLSSTCRASRRIGFFIWNIFFVVFFICTMTFTTFAVTYTATPNRLQLSFILLLTNITFKFTVCQSLPKISYLTYLDYYVLSCMITIGLICVWHGLVGTVVASNCPANEVVWIDRWVFIVFISIYIGGHVALILIIIFVVLRKRRIDRRRERDYNATIQTLSELSRSFQLDLISK